MVQAAAAGTADRSSSPQPSTSGSQVFPVQPERPSSSRPSTSAVQRRKLLAALRRARYRRRRRQWEVQARRTRMQEGFFEVEVEFDGPRPSVRIPPWVPPTAAEEVRAEVMAWWDHSPFSPEM